MSTPSRSKKSKNPFENGKFDRLIFSPGVFKSPKCESEDSSRDFQWTLEEQSFMAPAFVEFNQAVEEYHEERDERVQLFVDNYFKHEHYIPSPDLGASIKHQISRHSVASMNAKTVFKKENRRDCAVQTDLHIPLDIDLESLVKESLSDSYLSADRSFSSLKRRRQVFGSFSDTPVDSPSLEISESAGTSSSFSFDPSLSEMQFNMKENLSPTERLSMSSLNSDRLMGPLEEVSEECVAAREDLELSPIR